MIRHFIRRFYSRRRYGNGNRHIWICNCCRLNSPRYLLQPAVYDNGCYDAASVVAATPTTAQVCSHGHSSSPEHQVSIPCNFIEIFWIIHELQMPLSGYIKMPLRPTGIPHSHVWEDSKDRDNRFLTGYLFLLSTICPCLHLWLGPLAFVYLPLILLVSYAWFPCFVFPFMWCTPPSCSYWWSCLGPTAFKALVQSWNFPQDYAFLWMSTSSLTDKNVLFDWEHQVIKTSSH